MRMARMTPKDELLFEQAFRETRANHGTEITFYLPGMIRYESRRGRYPAISLTEAGVSSSANTARAAS